MEWLPGLLSFINAAMPTLAGMLNGFVKFFGKFLGAQG